MGGYSRLSAHLLPNRQTQLKKTMELCKKFLDFMATQEEAILTYRASKMVLAIHSDASYLSKPKARSQAGDHMFMAGNEEIPFNNGAILNILQIIRAVMSSAAKAELGALFINAKTAISIQQTLIKLGHLQPRTPMQTDNARAHALITNKNLTQSTQGHRHAFPLATVPQRPRTIPLLLETWHTKLG
jgi:hypothetical protein